MNTRTLAAFLSLTLCCASSGPAETLEWIRQFGTSSRDESSDVSADGLGSIYVSGNTEGSLEGGNAGRMDPFISKYDASGTLEWTRQFGTSSYDSGSGVSADGLGSVYITGWTDGSLEGTNAGKMDAFVSKYDASGSLQWTQQLGTSSMDGSPGVSPDRLGNVYICGRTDGNLGETNAGATDAFISKYDASGTLEWTRQLGTSEYEMSRGVSSDGLGSVFISGATRGSLGETNAGEMDVFVARFTDPLSI